MLRLLDNAPSVQRQFDKYGNQTSGFDYLRIILAVSVIIWHSYGISQGREAIKEALSNPLIGVVVHSVLPMFFALSGFLVTMSFFRANSIKTYVTFRFLRLFPALSVEVILSAVVLGPLVTTLAWSHYFSDKEFWLYFLNILGLVRYELPGVFENYIYSDVVNGSLWTVPYELECYIYLLAFALLGMLKNRWVLLAFFVAATLVNFYVPLGSFKGIVLFIKELFVGEMNPVANLQQIAGANEIQVSKIVVSSFVSGAIIFVFRDLIPYHRVLFVLSCIVGALLLSSPSLYLLSPLPLAYATVWLGMQTPPKIGFLKRGDYSYGVYLYGFPIQQLVANSQLAQGNFALTAVISLAIVSVFAIFSWHTIEKPCLSLKKRGIKKSAPLPHQQPKSEPSIS